MSINARIAALFTLAALSIAGAMASHFEGTRYTAYQDAGGIWTVCEGHTKGVKPGDVATRAQCDEYQRADLIEANNAIDKCVHVPLKITERAAHIDFIYNVGGTAFCGSTLVRMLNFGDHKAACQELMRWTYAGRVQLPGLIKRRLAERELCTRDYP